MKKDLLRAGAIYAAANVISAGVPFLLLPILTRALSPADYGEVIIFTLLVTLSSSLCGLSVHAAVSVKWFERHQRDFPRLVGSALLVAVLSTLVCGAALVAVSDVLRTRLELATPFWFMAAAQNGATTLVGVRAGLWQSQGRPLPAAAMQVAAAAMNMTLSLIGVFALEMGGEGRIYGSVSASVVCAAAAAWLLFHMGEARWSADRTDVKELARFGLPLVPHAFAGALLVTADRFSVSTILGPEALGVYGTAAQIGMAMSVLGDALVKAASPWMYAQMASRTPRASLRMVGATYALIPAWLLIALALWMAIRAAGSLIVGPRYVDAIDLSLWFFLGGAMSASSTSIAGLFFFTSKTEWLSVATMVAALFALVCAPALTRAFGVQGAAVSFFAIQMCALVAGWALSLWVQPMPWRRPKLALRVLRRAWTGK